MFDNEGARSAVLVRLFKTHAFGDLPPELQRRAQRAAPGQVVEPEARCLVLLGTAGDQPAWNSRHASVGHQAIPLLSEAMIRQSPMVSHLLQQFGVDIGAVGSRGKRAASALSPKTVSSPGIYELFHVGEAAGSPSIPAQEEFVRPYGVQSVVGFGGPLSHDDLFAAILFFRVPVPTDAAALFRSVALSMEVELLRFVLKPTFAE